MFGIGIILNLRQYHSDDKETKGADLQLYHANMNTRRINDQHVIEALKIIRDASTPVLVHCWHGSDRTGLMVAMYPIVFQNWTKDAFKASQIIDKVCFFLESLAKVKRQPCRKSFLRTAQSAGTSTGRAKNFPAGSAVARFSKK